MHRPKVIFISNQEQSGQQASKPKILNNSFKLTLKSAQKAKLPSNPSSRLVPQVSCRLSQSAINPQKDLNRQIVKNQIDGRLNKAYSSIVRHKSIQLTGKKTKKLELSSSQLRQMQSPEEFESDLKILQIDKKLLPYQLLRDYIQNIYQEYQIPDPLVQLKSPEQKINFTQSFISQAGSLQSHLPIETPTKPSRIVQQENRISTKKKILLLKNHFIDELNTERKSPLKLDRSQRNITDIPQQTSILQQSSQSKKNSNATSHKKKLSFALKQRFHAQQIFDKNTFNNLNLEETKFSTSSVNHLNLSMVHPTNDSYSHSRVENTRVISEYRSSQNRKVEQLFRYCFVCEQSILQANISHHEKTCTGLQEILTREKMSKQEFLGLMDKKIGKIEKEVRQILNQVQSKQMTDKITILKQKVLEWIGIIDKQSSLNKSTQFKRTLEEQKEIDSIIDNTKLMKTLELINKLKWFVHLKRNFLRKIQARPHLF